MRARIVVQHDANPETTAPEYASKLVPVTKRYMTGPKIEWVWPVGMIVEGDKALQLVQFGLADPIDQECADACGMTAAQLADAHLLMEAAGKGINSKEDIALYKAGVIVGYKQRASGGLEYDWGPNAEAYRAELAKMKADEAAE